MATFIKATTGDDVLTGTYDIDIFPSSLGDDVMDGREGSDYIDFRDAPSSARVDLAIKGPQDTGHGRDTLISIENITGSAFSDLLNGDDGNNSIESKAGDDVVDGRGGRDALWGGDGNDLLRGGDGDDSLTGDAGDDTLYGDRGNDFLSGNDGSDTLRGGDGMDWLSGGAGDDFIFGDANNDTISRSAGFDIIDGGAGSDTMSFQGYARAVTLDLSIAGQQTYAAGELIQLTSVEHIVGSDFADQLTGDAGANSLMAGGGNDVLDGGAGADTAVMSGISAFYAIAGTGREIKITDLRSGAPDGVDTLRNIEFIRFSDTLVPVGDGLSSMVTNLLRLSPDASAALVADLAGRVALGQLASNKVFQEVSNQALATTSVATLSYQFFTGKIPGEAGVNYLVSSTGPNGNNLNSVYYQSFNLENRYINFAMNLGKLGEGKDAFAAKYGTLTLFEATREAYKTIFGRAPTDEKVHAMIDGRVDYFASYGGDGAAGIGTKAAMVGWLLGEAAKADVGVMARSNEAWLMDIADGTTTFAVDLLDPAKGYYSTDFIFGG